MYATPPSTTGNENSPTGKRPKDMNDWKPKDWGAYYFEYARYLNNPVERDSWEFASRFKEKIEQETDSK